jgi:outer membrane receptor protein involved in Fe transport
MPFRGKFMATAFGRFLVKTLLDRPDGQKSREELNWKSLLKLMNLKIFLLISAFIFSILPFAFAQQEETGAISGSVQDVDGKAIPGVTIKASNMRLIGLNSSTSTGVDGSYRFPVLLPGEYEIKAELHGFQPVVRKDARLFAGLTLTVDFVLQPRPLSEVLVIQGETPAFDATSPSLSRTIPREEIENLPGFIGSINLFTITPGVGEDQVAYGSTPMGNAHTVDGVDITNQFSGLPVVEPNINWIEEVQVAGLGAPAEYGGFTGVVANSVSRSGSNEFHGLVETFFQDDSFNSNNVVDEDTTPFEKIFTDTTAQLGGPILRDKLWFFTGLQYLYTKERPFGSLTEMFFRRLEKNPRFIGKLTYKPNQNNTLQGFITRDNKSETGLEGDTSLPEATGFDERPLWFWNLGWISFLKSETVLDVRTRGIAGPRKITGRDPNLPAHLDGATGIFSQNYPNNQISDRFRNQVNAALSYYANDFISGNHDFKFGVQYERSHGDFESHFNGNMFYYDWDGAPYLRYTEDNHLEAITNTISTFAQDHWQFTDRLNLSIGVRWDHNRVKLLTDPVEYVTDGVAPRLGFAYALKENRTTILKIHYGHYYDNVASSFIEKLGHSSNRTTESFNQETQKWEVTDKSPGTSIYTIDDDLKQPYTRQFITGIDQVLPAEVNLSVHYIYKRDQDLLEDVDTTSQFEPVPYVNPITGKTITVYNRVDPGDGTKFITNKSILFRRYHGFEIYGSKRLSDKFYLAGSIVFSAVKGNVDNDRVEGNGLSAVLNSPNDQINSVGQLENDVSTEIKLHGYYYLPWGINSSWYFRHFSGETWTPLVRVTGLNQGPFKIYGLPRGSNRLPGRNTVDIRIEKMFPLYRGHLRFTLDVFNLFNTGYTLAVDPDYESETFGEPTDFSPPREFRIGIRYTF